MKNCRRPEPTLTETLSDPVVRAMMTADAVDPHALLALLHEVASKVAADPAAARSTTSEPW